MIRAINYLIDVLFVAVVFVVSLIVIYMLYDAAVVANGSELNEDIVVVEPKEDNDDDFDLAELKKINANIVGWIRIDDTNINYPVLQAKDNSYYLSRNYRDEFAVAGSVFLDYRDDILESDFFIIYGHRMSYGKMFSDITKFAEQKYFEDHLGGVLYSDKKVFRLETVGFGKIKANEKDVYGIHRNDDKVIGILKQKSYYWKTNNADRYVLLSTCDGKDKTLRNVLLLAVK